MLRNKQDNYYRSLRQLEQSKKEREIKEYHADELEAKRIQYANERRLQALHDALNSEERRKRKCWYIYREH